MRSAASFDSGIILLAATIFSGTFMALAQSICHVIPAFVNHSHLWKEDSLWYLEIRMSSDLLGAVLRRIDRRQKALRATTGKRVSDRSVSLAAAI
jgi:hypothetical protein